MDKISFSAWVRDENTQDERLLWCRYSTKKLQPVLFAILGSLVLSRKQPIFTAVMSVTIVIQVVSTVGDAREPVQFNTFDLHCEQTSWVPNQFIFAQNALIRRMKRNKLVPCW